jgi:hypothetical protein
VLAKSRVILQHVLYTRFQRALGVKRGVESCQRGFGGKEETRWEARGGARGVTVERPTRWWEEKRPSQHVEAMPKNENALLTHQSRPALLAEQSVNVILTTT